MAYTLTAPLALLSPHLAAQASCSSDGAPRPVALFERFISTDCEACWSDRATPVPSASALVLDWIGPGFCCWWKPCLHEPRAQPSPKILLETCSRAHGKSASSYHKQSKSTG